MVELGTWGGGVVYPYSLTRVLIADLDDGTAEHDAFGIEEDKPQTGVTREGIGAYGDSGGPWFETIDGSQYVVGVHSRGNRYDDPDWYDRNINGITQPDRDSEYNRTIGELSMATRVGMNYARFIQPNTTPGPTNLVLDMGYQVFGRTPSAAGGTDNLVITAQTVNGNVQLSVTNLDEPASMYNGVYYSVPAAKLSSLTLRGTADNEKFRIVGDLGINGNVYIDGREGEDEIEYDDSAANGPHNYTLEGIAGNYNLRLNRAVGEPAQPIPGIDSRDVEKYTIRTSQGADVVRIEAAPANFVNDTNLINGVYVFTNDGDDTVKVGIDGAAGGMSKIAATVSVDGGNGLNNFFAVDATTDDGRHNYTLDNKAAAGYDFRLNRAFGVGEQGLSPIDAIRVSQYTLKASPGVDKIRVESAPVSINRGLYIEGNGGNDQFHIGSNSLGTMADIRETVCVDGGAGDDTLEFHDESANADGYQYTIGPTTGAPAGWDMRMNRWTGAAQHGVDSKDFLKYTLYAGSGKDIIRVEKVSSALAHGLYIYGNGDDDDMYVGSESVGFDLIQGTAYLDGAAGEKNTLTYLDDKGSAARSYVLGLSDIGDWDMRLGVVGSSGVAYSKFISKYALKATQQSDTVQVDATSNLAARGTLVYGNGGNDTITVGSAADGLKFVRGTVTVEGGLGTDNLIIDDRNGTAGQHIVYASKFEKDGGSPTIESTDALNRTIKGAPGGNVINIRGNPGGAESNLAILAGADGDTVAVGVMGAMESILGAVSIDGEAGVDTFQVFADLFDPAIVALERLVLGEGVLTFNSTPASFQDIVQTGGTLAGAANATASQSLVWSGGTMSGAGTTTALQNAEISGTVTLSRMLELAGSTNWTAHILGMGTLLNWGTLVTAGAITDGNLNNVGTILPGGNDLIDSIQVGLNFNHTGGTIRFDVSGGAVDSFSVNGLVTLGGAMAIVPLGGPYSPRYTLISNSMQDAVVNTFAGYPQGMLVTALAPRFHSMNYHGGDGNDVLLDNFGPDAVNDAVCTDEDTPADFAVLANDTDPENDALAITGVSTPPHGTAAIVGSVIHYTPVANYTGPDSFIYTVSDGHGGTDTATVSITVHPVNDIPVAVNDTCMAGNGGMPVAVGVLWNDSDIDGDTLQVSAVTQPAHGSVTINASGTWVTYTSSGQGFVGTDTFTYTMNDGHGGTATANVSMEVYSVSPPPPPPMSPPPPGSPPPPPPMSPPPPPAGYGSFNGWVWDDANHNGIQEQTEASFYTPIQILLLDSNGNTVASTWSTGGMLLVLEHCQRGVSDSDDSPAGLRVLAA